MGARARRLTGGVAGILAGLLLAAGAGQAGAAVQTASSGGVSATLTYAGTLYEPGPVTLDIARDGVVQRLTGFGDAGGDAPAYGVAGPGAVRVRDLDGQGAPEVLVRLYSGGAHCCTRSAIATLSPQSGTWSLQTHDWGDAAWVLRDLDRDGAPELVSWDARWAYWGGVYATSPRPIQIWSVRDGALVDVTRAHRAAVLRDQAAQWRYYAHHRNLRQGLRGVLATYVIDGYSAGRPAAAWTRVYAAYRRPDRLRFFTALRNRLTRLGYRAASDPVPPVR
ncbi:MAG: hypothetical protein AB7V42_01625 [Thermoleophilia bacterium]